MKKLLIGLALIGAVAMGGCGDPGPNGDDDAYSRTSKAAAKSAQKSAVSAQPRMTYTH